MAKNGRGGVPEDWDFSKLSGLRKKAGLQVNELAAACGVWPQTVYNWESGRTRPSIVEFLAVLRALKCDFWDLMPDQ